MNNLTPEQRARIVRAKAHELEGRSLERGVEDELGYLVADVALLFDLLAEHLEEHQETAGPIGRLRLSDTADD